MMAVVLDGGGGRRRRAVTFERVLLISRPFDVLFGRELNQNQIKSFRTFEVVKYFFSKYYVYFYTTSIIRWKTKQDHQELSTNHSMSHPAEEDHSNNAYNHANDEAATTAPAPEILILLVRASSNYALPKTSAPLRSSNCLPCSSRVEYRLLLLDKAPPVS